MRLKYKHNTLRYLTILIAAFIVTGCASTGGMQRSEEVRTTMDSIDKDIREATQQLNATETSLENLMRPNQTDIKKTFSAYKENVSKMESIEKDFAMHSDQLKSRGNDYFQEWEKDGSEYNNPQIQKLSEQRRAELGDIYGRIAENSIGVSEAFKTYVSDVKEIQSFLSNDLTAKGIDAITPTSRTVVSDGDSLKHALQDMQSAIQRARAEMSASGTK